MLSGANAVLGEDMVYGIEVAVDDRGGELLGHEIELNVQDELCTVEGGAQAALALAIDPTVVGIIGSSCSDATVGGIQTITEAGLTTISGSATRPSLTDAGPRSRVRRLPAHGAPATRSRASSWPTSCTTSWA